MTKIKYVLVLTIVVICNTPTIMHQLIIIVLCIVTAHISTRLDNTINNIKPITSDLLPVSYYLHNKQLSVKRQSKVTVLT